jgi:hypothetical protein
MPFCMPGKIAIGIPRKSAKSKRRGLWMVERVHRRWYVFFTCPQQYGVGACGAINRVPAAEVRWIHPWEYKGVKELEKDRTSAAVTNSCHHCNRCRHGSRWLFIGWKKPGVVRS